MHERNAKRSQLPRVCMVFSMRCALVAVLSPATLQSQSIQTIAGGGGDSGSALAVPIGYPAGVAVDAKGNVYVVDTVNARIRKISVGIGFVTTIGGNGTSIDSGDGGPATNAGFWSMNGVIVDAEGNVYVSSRKCIRLIAASTGVISTMVGNGTVGFSGDGGPATAASVLEARGLAFDSVGNLYFSDTANGRIRKVLRTTGTIQTIAGNGSWSHSGDGGPATGAGFIPYGIAIDPGGDVFIADPFGFRVRRVSAASGIITTFAGNGSPGFSGDGGAATMASLGFPADVGLDRQGNLYIADGGNNRIRRVDARTGVITSVAGNGNPGFFGDGGPALLAGLYDPEGITIGPSGNVVISDARNHRIREVSAVTGVITTIAGSGHDGFSGDGGPATQATLFRPQGVGIDHAGNVYIADTFNQRIRRVTSTTGTIHTVAGAGGGYVGGGFSGDGGPATAARLCNPMSVAIEESGDFYIADSCNRRVRKVSTSTGRIETIAGTGGTAFSGDGGLATAAEFQSVSGVAIDPTRNIFIKSYRRIRRVSPYTGLITTVAGNGNGGFSGDGGPATAASLEAGGVAADREGNLYVSDSGNDRIRRIASFSQSIATVAGSGITGFTGDGGLATAASLSFPLAIAVDQAENLYFTDSYPDQRVRVVDAKTGLISTIAGVGKPGFSGDGGPATAANLYQFDGDQTTGIAVDGVGNLFIADSLNHRVRAVYACRSSLGTFDASYPGDGAGASSAALNISWAGADGSFRYDLLLDTEFPPRRVVQQDVTGQGLALSGLLPGKTYYWQVRAKGDPYCPAVERTSGVRRFTTSTPCSPPAAPVLENVTVQGTSAVLRYGAAAGAALYDVYLGTGTSPLARIASGVPAGSFNATGLSPGTTYRWKVVGHATCNTALAFSSLEGEFRVPGTCLVAENPRLAFPANAGTGVPGDVVLRWNASAGASSYDVYVDDERVASGRRGVELPVSLASGRTYRWRVVSHAGCDDSRTALSESWSFATAACPTPAIPGGVASTKGNAQQGSAYALTWASAEGVEPGGSYRIERAKSGDFTGAETFSTRETSLVLTATEKATYFHRVAAQASCGTPSAWSSLVQVSVSKAPPFLTMTNPPKATVIAQPKAGIPLPKLEVEVRNTGTTDFVGYFNTSQTVPFFIMNETFFSMRAGEIRIFYLQFSGVPMNQPGQYEGTLSIQSQDPTDTTAYPQASISLSITSNKGENPLPQTTAPVLQVDGKSIETLRFAPAGLGELAPELTLDIKNAGSAPLDLAADVLPDPWISIGPKGWNSVPIQPNGTRTVRLSLERFRGESGGSFPRQTYVTFRTIDGKSSRILVEDPGPQALGSCRGRPLLASGEASWMVPSLVSAAGAGGVRFVSTVLLTNLGPDTIQADLFYTPDVPGADGYDCTKVQVASLVVPGNDVLVLTDPVAQLFGTEGSGSLEIRSDSPGQLRITSFVDAPASGGGSFGFQLPVFASREGVRAGKPYVVTGVNHATPYRTNLILTETSGQTSSVTITLYDRSGKPLGSTERTLNPYTKTQLSIGELAGSNAVNGGAVEVAANAGSAGTVAPLTTVIDGRTGDASCFAGMPMGASASTLVLPSVVTSTTFNSRVEVRNNTDRVAKYRMTYLGNTGSLTSAERALDPRQADIFENVLRDAFNLPSTQTSFGPLHIEAETASLSVASRVHVETPSGSYGDAIEGYTLDDARTTGESNRILIAEGLEGTARGDRTRGARTNLILTEITGSPVEVEVTIWEKTQRRLAPVGTLTLKLNGYEQRQINDIFGDAGFAIGEKDRANVMCQIRPKAASTGRVVALATRIDNKTNDTKNLALEP